MSRLLRFTIQLVYFSVLIVAVIPTIQAGTHSVWGKIFEKYEIIGDENGVKGTRSKWGFPISDRYWVEEQGMDCQDFEGGRICEEDVCVEGTVWDNESKDCISVCNPDELWNPVISKCENYFLSKVVSPVGDQTCDGVVFTSGYGYRTNPIDGSIQLHDGVDLAKEGGCIIKSVMSGSLSHESGYGNTVKIIHDTRFTTIYGHGSNYLNNPGQSISGDNIMYMGCTGQCTGTHLHFVVREGGDSFDYHTDPVPYFQRYFKLLYGFNE